MSVVSELQALNFHDSRLVEVGLSFPGGNARACVIDIDYYDWEGNAKRRADDANAAWLTKRLRLSFGFLAHIEFSAPDLVNRAQDFDEAEVGYCLSTFQARYAAFKREFPHGFYPLFEDGSEVISLRFSTQNNDEHKSGSLWLVGSKVELEWLAAPRHAGQIHFPISDA
jgi:hypothetical protein